MAVERNLPPTGQDRLVTFRRMTLEDVPRVREIDVLSFSMPWSERSYRFELSENRHSSVWVAELTQQDGSRLVIGMIVIWVVLDEAHVATVAIHPSHRGSGIGRRLLATGLLAAYERGARMAFLEVRRGNLVAQALYEKFGFQVAGIRPRYYKDNNEDALLMNLNPMQPDVLQTFAD